MPGMKSVNQLLAEEQARLMAAAPGFPPPRISAPREDLVFRAEESVPEIDLREMPKEERPKFDGYIHANLARRVLMEMLGKNLIQFSEDKDPKGRRRIFRAELRLPVGVAPTQPPEPPLPEPQPPEPKGPSEADMAKMRTDVRREATAKVKADVAKALNEVEANLIPGADPAFILVLLRDKLGLDA